MKDIIEERLYNVMDEVVASTEKKAKEIFKKNNSLVFEKIEHQKIRVDDIVKYHKVQQAMFDNLTQSNRDAIKLHNEIKKVF